MIGPPDGERRQWLGLREQAVADVTSRYCVLLPEAAPADLNDAALLSVDLPAPLQGLVERRRAGHPDFHAPPIGATLERLRLGTGERGVRGHVRWFPLGVVARHLVQSWLERFLVDDLRSSPIQTPAVFQWTDEMAELAGSFRDRIYEVSESDSGRSQPLGLRYGGDPGFFGVLSDVRLRSEHFPWRVHELVEAFRRNRSGELRLIQRTRSFEFFDCHIVCADGAQGLQEYLRLLDGQLEMLARLGTDHVASVVAVEGDTEAERALQGWVDRRNRPILVELMSRRRHYYRIQHNIYDVRGLRTMHGQLDEVNGPRWRPSDNDPPVVVHHSTGSLERWLLAFLLAGMDEGSPGWPIWLAPVHVRLIPVRAEHVPVASSIGERLVRRGMRVEVDDRAHPVSKRVRDSDAQWIPFVVVVGDDDEVARVRLRGGELRPMAEDDLVRAAEVDGRPVMRPLVHLTHEPGYT
jgi:threonyl-tRNA synthetase